jgi:hypothetical protein
MIIKGKNRSVEIPGWAVLVGLLIVDNMATNVCTLKQTKILKNCMKNGKSN